MGAEMVGYIVVGPETIGVGRASAARRVFRAWAEEHANEYVCETCDHAPLGDHVTRTRVCAECGDRTARVRAVWTPQAIRARIAAVIADWPPVDYRDCMVREVPGDPQHIIVAAGAMTWGDEPEGGAYCALGLSLALPRDVRAALGLR